MVTSSMVTQVQVIYMLIQLASEVQALLYYALALLIFFSFSDLYYQKLSFPKMKTSEIFSRSQESLKIMTFLFQNRFLFIRINQNIMFFDMQKKQEKMNFRKEEIKRKKVSKEWYVQKQRQTNHHGFEHRFKFFQLLGILLVAIPHAFFIFTSMENLENVAMVISYVIECFFLLLAIFFWFRVTIIDPSDSIRQKHLSAIIGDKIFNIQEAETQICLKCRTFTSKKAFHCSSCQRCVELFDHHCRWLNNCIGAKNYLEFIWLILLLSVKFLYLLIMNILFLSQRKGETHFINLVKTIQIISVIYDSVFFCLFLCLLCFHAVLIMKRKKTFEIILKIRRKTSDENLKKKQQDSNFSPSVETVDLKLAPISINSQFQSSRDFVIKKRMIKSERIACQKENAEPHR